MAASELSQRCFGGACLWAPEAPCRKLTCEICGPVWLRNWRQVLDAAMDVHNGPHVSFVVTAPGADRLPWDERVCPWRGPHHHDGKAGCRCSALELAECTIGLRRIGRGYCSWFSSESPVNSVAALRSSSACGSRRTRCWAPARCREREGPGLGGMRRQRQGRAAEGAASPSHGPAWSADRGAAALPQDVPPWAADPRVSGQARARSHSRGLSPSESDDGSDRGLDEGVG